MPLRALVVLGLGCGHRHALRRRRRLLASRKGSLVGRLLALGPLRIVLAPLVRILLPTVALAPDHVVELVARLAQRPGLRALPRPARGRLLVQVPAHLAVQVLVRVEPQRPDDVTDDARHGGRDRRAGSLLVEGRELVREPRHRAADARAARVHAAADVVDRAARGDVAVDDGAPAADLDEALRIAELLCERPLLVVRAANAMPVDGLAEEPRGAAELVEFGQRPEALQEV